LKFESYERSKSIPNVIVDGTANQATVLTLSHWRQSGTPEPLLADTSAEIVFNYLDSPKYHVDVPAVSNNHFDEDGLVGVFSLINPEFAIRHRELLISVATAGDFGVVRDPLAAKIVFTLNAFADAERSPLPKHLFKLRYPEHAAALYEELIRRLPDFVEKTDGYETLWRDENDSWKASEALCDSQKVVIEENTDLDLAIVRIPENIADCHPFAIHSRTKCSRLIYLRGKRVEFQYRYEGWVRLATRRPLLRVDMDALTEELNREDATSGKWIFEREVGISPRLYREGSSSILNAADVVSKIEHHLRTAPAAWNPYE